MNLSIRFFRHRCHTFLILVLAVAVSSVSTSTQGETKHSGTISPVEDVGVSYDPIEPFNRHMFRFNLLVDRYIIAPIALGYWYIVPKFARSGVGNFLSNLGEPIDVINNTLQGDIEGAFTSVMRFVTNTTFGFLGLLDVASEVGVQKDDEDFGQTLGVWGVGPGYYLVLPIMGATTTRDITAKFGLERRLYIQDKAWSEEVTAWPKEATEEKQNSAKISEEIHKYNIRIFNGRSFAYDSDEPDMHEMDDNEELDVYILMRDNYYKGRERAVKDAKRDAFDGGEEGEEGAEGKKGENNDV